MRKINLAENRILQTVRKHNMFSVNDRVLVGFSGGKDSVALLYALKTLSPILKISVVAFHLNHSIRGEEAKRDEEFAKSFCEKICVPFFSESVDVPKLAESSSLSIEETARKVRYKKFEELALREGCNKIATAHTASDNTETFLITLLRNGNSKGIPPVRSNIVRPLIELTTQEVIEYCENNNLEFVFDSTNACDDYTRNYLRNKVIPELKKIQPSLDGAVLKSSEILRAHESLAESIAQNYLENEQNPMGLAFLNTLAEDFSKRNILYSMLNLIVREYNITVSYSQFFDIINLILNGRVGQKVVLTDSFFFVRSYDELELKSQVQTFDDYKFEIKRGANPIPDSNIVLYLETEEEYLKRFCNNEQENKKINKLTKNALIKYNIINSCLLARTRKAGDCYISGGITRNIKKYMINEKIPSEIRSRIPVVCDEDGPLWVAGLGVADRIKNNDGEFLSLSIDFKNKAVER